MKNDPSDDRLFIRHPTDIPLAYQVIRSGKEHSMRDISPGGLSFCSGENLPVGTEIQLSVDLGEVSGSIVGVVVWTRELEGRYEVGVRFPPGADKFHFRLVEQICAIAHYRNEVREKEGRDLSNEEAACEWIEKYAKDFPE